jgi:hypothetical protein
MNAKDKMIRLYEGIDLNIYNTLDYEIKDAFKDCIYYLIKEVSTDEKLEKILNVLLDTLNIEDDFNGDVALVEELRKAIK